MAPWPEQGNEPKAPDKSCNKSGENSSLEASKVNVGNTEDSEVNATTATCDDKQSGLPGGYAEPQADGAEPQERPGCGAPGDAAGALAARASRLANNADDHNAHVSNLDDGQLRALLDEAIAYKCPKDREGKSNLFRELLQEAEANEDGESRRGLAAVGGSRYYSNSNRRRGRRDAQVSERQTRGGSLQNLVHASNSEFDPAAGFGGYHSGGSRTARKSKRLSTGSGSYGSGSVGGSGSGRDCGGVSVSARQREGGSLPSNVNVGGMLTLSGLDYHTTPTSLPFDDIKSCKQVAARRKELTHSSSSNEFMSIPVQTSTANSSNSGNSSVESGSATVSSNNNSVVPKSEFMVLDLGDYVGEKAGESKGGNSSSVSVSNNVASSNSANVDNGLASAPQSEEKKGTSDSNGTEEGVELEVLQRAELTARVPNYTSRATLEVGHGESKKASSNSGASEAVGEVDTGDIFPLEVVQCSEKTSSTAAVNGVEQSSLQLRSSYNSVKSIMSSSSSCTGPREDRSNVNKGSDITKRSAGSESVGKATAASAAAPTSAANAASGAMPMLSMQHHLSVLSLPPTSWINAPLVPDVNRLTFTHGSSKDCSGESKNKSLDENGNAVNRLESTNSNSTERKGKQRKTKTNNDRNVIMSQNIEGYRGDKDIDTVLKFIESNSDGKGTNKTKNTTSHSNGPMNFSSKQQRNCSRLIGCGTKGRRERGVEDPSADEDRIGKGRTGSGKQVSKEHRGKGSKLKKSNSLEEISKTKLEDLTSNSKEGSESGVGSMAGNDNNNEDNSSVLVRRPKKQSTLDNGEFYGEKTRVGDRRSWGTEEGQQYYCNDGVTVSADEGSTGSGQNSRKRRGNASISSTVSSDEKRKVERDENISVTPLAAATAAGSGASEETEFLVVTKRQRRKKRRSSSGGRGTSASAGGGIFGDDGWRPYHHNYGGPYYQNREGGGGPYYQRKTFTNTSSGFPPHDRTVERDSGGVMLYTQYRHHRPRSPDHLRRKSTSSMPPSDKSDSSDLDSVHSLPVSSTTPKLTLDQTSTSSGSTPQASYADIARMASTNVPSAPSHSHNYVNINLNASRWPVMGMPKSTASANPANSVVSSTTVTITAPTSSNSVVTAPIVSSNPQFITGPKLNIGVPPVSGSKVGVFSGNSATSGTQSASPSTVPVVSGTASEDVGQVPARKESDNVQCPPSEQVSVSKSRSSSSPADTRTRKDAMTNTSLEYNAVSPNVSSEERESSLSQSNTSGPIETVVNFLRDGEYPSLEESLSSDKLKNTKINQVHSSHGQFAGENSSVQTSSGNSPDRDNSTNLTATTVSEHEKDCVVNEKRVASVDSAVGAGFSATAVTTATATTTSAAVATTVTATTTSAAAAVAATSTAAAAAAVAAAVPFTAATVVAVTTSIAVTTATTTSAGVTAVATATNTISQKCVPDSAATAGVSGVQSGVDMTDLAKCKDANVCKAKNINKKASVSGCRPPVIIMDENDQTFPYSDGLTTASELTFGFEVNEQLLMSDIADDVTEEKPSAPAHVPDSPKGSAEEVNSTVVPALTAVPATACCSPGEDFSARYREPPTQPDNHDKIVTFVGSAWDDVLKEMNGTPVHSGGKVRYYNGQ